jgi:NAD(P)-dependent dehydrogenase (short-subunit alcohol dehydrogenase family)
MQKTALITGGSSGLGFALAELLGKQGYAIAEEAHKRGASVTLISTVDRLRTHLLEPHFQQRSANAQTWNPNILVTLISRVRPRQLQLEFPAALALPT